MSRPRCDSCRWAETLPAEARGYAICRRHPPVAMVTPGAPESDATGIGYPIWPIVWPSDWCAEHQAKRLGDGDGGEVLSFPVGAA